MAKEKPIKAPDVDPEIDALHGVYQAFRAMDRPAQMRCLRWLHQRLARDHAESEKGKGEAP
jgi:hypothetical protein